MTRMTKSKKAKEIDTLKSDITARKMQLKAEGLSGRQQNKDDQIVKWVTRVNELKLTDLEDATNWLAGTMRVLQKKICGLEQQVHVQQKWTSGAAGIAKNSDSTLTFNSAEPRMSKESGAYEGSAPDIIGVNADFKGDGPADFDLKVTIATKQFNCPGEKITESDSGVTSTDIETTGDCPGDGIRTDGKNPTKYTMAPSKLTATMDPTQPTTAPPGHLAVLQCDKVLRDFEEVCRRIGQDVTTQLQLKYEMMDEANKFAKCVKEQSGANNMCELSRQFDTLKLEVADNYKKCKARDHRLKLEVAEMQVQMRHTGEDRETENKILHCLESEVVEMQAQMKRTGEKHERETIELTRNILHHTAEKIKTIQGIVLKGVTEATDEMTRRMATQESALRHTSEKIKTIQGIVLTCYSDMKVLSSTVTSAPTMVPTTHSLSESTTMDPSKLTTTGSQTIEAKSKTMETKSETNITFSKAIQKTTTMDPMEPTNPALMDPTTMLTTGDEWWDCQETCDTDIEVPSAAICDSLKTTTMDSKEATTVALVDPTTTIKIGDEWLDCHGIAGDTNISRSFTNHWLDNRNMQCAIGIALMCLMVVIFVPFGKDRMSDNFSSTCSYLTLVDD